MSRARGQSPMTEAWRTAIAAGQKRAWTNLDIRKRRSAAIARAQDCPLHRAIMRRIKLAQGKP